MYSLSGRANNITFNTLIALAVLSALNFCSVRFNLKDPADVKFNFLHFDTFVQDRYVGEEAASFLFDFQADFTPLMNWNTNIIFASIQAEFNTTKSGLNRMTLWDKRIYRWEPAEHKIQLFREYPEYYLTDVNKELKDTEVHLYLHWE